MEEREGVVGEREGLGRRREGDAWSEAVEGFGLGGEAAAWVGCGV